MSRMIDADLLEKEGWSLHRTYQKDKTTMAYEVKAISEINTAQPERKKGKWIEFDSDEDKYDIIKCSCCKHIFTVDSYHWSDIGFVKDDFNFCPNCGSYNGGE